MESPTLQFNDLPNAISCLRREVRELKELLQKPQIDQSQDQWFNLKELISYLPDKPAKATLYAWVSQGLIPCHKGQKKLRFLKSEIDAWMKEDRRKTIKETAQEADEFLNKKGGLNG
jgi:predicted DNA-binding transcriptional regulator AlpA